MAIAQRKLLDAPLQRGPRVARKVHAVVGLHGLDKGFQRLMFRKRRVDHAALNHTRIIENSLSRSTGLAR